MAENVNDSPEDVFTLLSDETRLAILRELADAADEAFTPQSDPVSYSELMDRVGVSDSGNFNYHLNALQERFVSNVDGGYRVRRAGLEIVRALRAGNFVEATPVEPTGVDEACPYCNAPIEVTVDDGWLLVSCTDCTGLYGGMESVPEGLFIAHEVSPAAMLGRTVAELFRVILVSSQQHAHLGFEGICPDCTGPVESEFVVCSNHDTGGRRVCESCGRPTPVVARGECVACGLVQVGPPAYTVWNHDPTRQRLEEAGVTGGDSLWTRTIEPITWNCSVECGDETLVHYRIPV